ncbi:MAG: hypothetical protein AABX07_02965 [Nanoarchaeota archaeon]
MNKKLSIGILVLAALAIALFVGLSISGMYTPTGSAVKTINNEKGLVKEFTISSFTEIVDGKYFPQFSLKEISVNKGDFIRIKITNTKGTHDFKIDEFNAYAETPLNQEVIIEFTADKAGSFEYYCTKTGHRQNGHWGTLKVLE